MIMRQSQLESGDPNFRELSAGRLHDAMLTAKEVLEMLPTYGNWNNRREELELVLAGLYRVIKRIEGTDTVERRNA